MSPEPADGLPGEEKEPQAIPSFGRAGSEATTRRDNYGVTIGSAGRDVTVNNHRDDPPELVARRATSAELRLVEEQFVQPLEFASAARILDAQHVLVLCGQGTGRSHTAKRLLVDSGVTSVAELNPERALGSVRAHELDEKHGYVWNLEELGKQPFRDVEYQQCAELVRAAGCRLVIIVGHQRQSCRAALNQTVSLTAPDPIEVALTVVRRQCVASEESPMLIVKTDLASALANGEPPDKAVRAAELAIQVADGDLDVDRALAELQEEIDESVARWFDGWSVLEYSMAVAVAVLDGEPFDDVVAHARKLDQRIRTEQLPEDKFLRPRRVFEKPKEQLLRDIRAASVTRDHPRHPGLREDTVGFERREWAQGVLCHVWLEYPSARELLQSWLSDGVREVAARKAMCTIISRVPAHDPLRYLRKLAKDAKWRSRRMAASVLVRLADDHHLLPLVHATLREWVECDSARQQWTAALVYSSPFGRRDLDESLAQLARIGSSRHPSPKNVVVFGVLAMLEEPADQEKVINTVVEWSESAHRRRGTLREVSLSLGLWLAGVYQGAGVDPVDFAERWTSQMQTLMCRVLADREFGVVALHHLSDLATRSRWDPGSGSELLRLAEIIAPDLRWWSRRRRIAELVDAHPTMGADIRRTFRIARRFQRRRDRAASGRGMGADLVADLNLSSRRRPRRFLPGGRRWRRRR